MNEENEPQKADGAPKWPTYSTIGRTIVVMGSVSRTGNSQTPPKNKDKN